MYSAVRLSGAQLKKRYYYYYYYYNAWEEFDQLVIDAAIGKWRKRLEACAAAEGRDFEHTL